MKLHTLKPALGSVRNDTRKGRGTGSGKGGTSTRGHKGNQSRSGHKRKIGFEGGQMPLQRRVPKFGFKNPTRIEYQVLKLSRISEFVQETGITIITPEVLHKNRIVSKNDLVKVLNTGELTKAVEIHAHAFSATAKEAIEQAGGKAIIVK